MSEEQLDPKEPVNPNPSPFQQTPFPNQPGYQGLQQNLPNATLVLVLGIISIVTCCCFYGLVGIILGVIALVLSKKDRNLYASYPGTYTESSFKNLNAGRVCAIVGLVLSAILLISCAIFIAIYGYATLTDREAMTEIFRNMQ